MAEDVNTGAAAAEGAQTPEGTVASYSQEQLDAAVAEAVAAANAGVEERIRQEREDAENLARLSEQERAAEEQKRERDAFEAEKKEFAKRQRTAYAAEQLTAAKLPTSLAEQLTGTDDEATKKNVDALAKAFTDAVTAGVTAKLQGKPPKGGGTPAGGSDMEKIIAASMARGF